MRTSLTVKVCHMLAHRPQREHEADGNGDQAKKQQKSHDAYQHRAETQKRYLLLVFLLLFHNLVFYAQRQRKTKKRRPT